MTIQETKYGHYGGSLGGPVFKKVMTFVLQSEHVAPTGTKVMPIALTEAELVKQKNKKVMAQTSQVSLKKN